MSDLIDRQAAIDAVEESRRLNHHQDGKEACAHEYEHRHFLKLLRDLPSAQPEQKKGKWIDAVIPNDNGGLPVQVCDQCNTFFPLAYTGGGHRFCPNCGADMRGGEDERLYQQAGGD